MIRYFSVENFKGFEKRIELDLFNVHDYKFHSELIKNGISNKSLLFGKNGSGKSNLGKAIMDISRHLTSNLKKSQMTAYKNYNHLDKPVHFEYVFKFNDDEVIYRYSKENEETLLKEEMLINDKSVLSCDFLHKTTSLSLEGSEELDVSKFDFSISFALFVYSRSGYIKESPFDKFFDFVNRMLFFRSLKENEFEGFQSRGKNFADILIEHGKEKSLRDLERFLDKEGLKYNLSIEYDALTNQNVIYAKFGNKSVPLHLIWSTGTSSLVLFYCWLLDLKRTSFLFLDEFDAFYHYELSEDILKIISEDDSYQAIISTHNCALMTNKLTRPDCCYIIRDNEIVKNLTECTSREIREAHNLENLYKNGAFSE